jgi:hypothetical protein
VEGRLDEPREIVADTMDLSLTQILSHLKIRGTTDERAVIKYLQGDDFPFGSPVCCRYL